MTLENIIYYNGNFTFIMSCNVLNSIKINKIINSCCKIHYKYSSREEFIKTLKANQDILNQNLGNESIDAFYEYLDGLARNHPGMLHHVYEWGKLGMPSGRLFFLWKESATNGTLIIKPGFIQSRTKVPVDPLLRIPGRTGKSVASKHIFRNKASVMESGRTIVYRTSKNLPMTQDGKVRFVAAGTVIRNPHPGGKEVKGSFENYFNYWFAKKINSVIKSAGIIQSIDSEISKILNKPKAGPAQVRTAIINLLKQYSANEDVI